MDEVITAFSRYVAMLRRKGAPMAGPHSVSHLIALPVLLTHPAGPQEWIFKELKQLEEIGFRFMDTQPPSTSCISLSSALRLHPARNILNARYAMSRFDPGGLVDHRYFLSGLCWASGTMFHVNRA